MIEIENVANKSCSPNLIFRKENRFQEDWVDVWPRKLTLKMPNGLILPSLVIAQKMLPLKQIYIKMVKRFV